MLLPYFALISYTGCRVCPGTVGVAVNRLKGPSVNDVTPMGREGVEKNGNLG